MSLKVVKQPFNAIWVSATTQQELGETFIRFQEHYESDNPKFRGQIFTLGQVKQWYSELDGYDSYSKYWVGFNFPSKVLEPFRKGLFDPLTSGEKELLKKVKYRSTNFYVIGAQDNEVLRHELAHALYGYSEQYRNAVNSYIQSHSRKFAAVKRYLKKIGYCDAVLNDEVQAYVTDNDNVFIMDNLDPDLIAGLNRLWKKYRNKYENLTRSDHRL